MKHFFLLKCSVGLAIVTCLVTLGAFAQSPSPITFYTNPLQLNPAIMGTNHDLKGVLDYRSQWTGIENGYTTMNFNGMYPVMIDHQKGKLDVGIYMQRDAAGAFTNTNGGIAVDYNKEIAPDNTICLALSGGYMQQALSTSGLTFDNQYALGSFNPSIMGSSTIAYQKVGLPVVNAGAMWTLNKSHDINTMDAYVGISGFNLNSPNASHSGITTWGLAPLYSVQAGVKMLSNSILDIMPNFVLSAQSGSTKTALGLKLDYKLEGSTRVVFATWYGKSDGLSFMAGVFYKNLTVNYLYEVVTSNAGSLIDNALSVNEVVVSYQFRTKQWAEKKVD